MPAPLERKTGWLKSESIFNQRVPIARTSGRAAEPAAAVREINPRRSLSMTVSDLRTQFDYGYWANAGLFGVASSLTTEQFTQPVSGSHGSIRNTLVHMMSTEWGWMERAGGFARGPKLIASDYPTLDSIRERWTEIESHLRRFLDGLQDGDLDRVVEFALGDGPKLKLSVGEMMQHAAIHGVHHRGQVALLLRSLGYVPGDFDMVFYYLQLRQA